MSRTPRSATRHLARGAAAVATGLAVAVVPMAALTTSASATTPTTTHVAKGCAAGALPAVVKGRPAGFKAGLPAGAWVWRDARGFHLRVTHDSRTKLVFTGTIASSGRLSAHRIARDERQDVLWRNSQHKAVRFVLRNHGGVDGVDFRIGCAKSVTITVKAAGQKLSTTQIHLGATAANPTSNPVVIGRS